LTNNEQTAFEAIREEIGSSGNISVVKMIQKTSISRPVWTSLLAKMEKFGIAQVKSQGVKGTYIEISKEIDNDV
jgi:GTP-sensing pleiotropic transcriptional regulator CodY